MRRKGFATTGLLLLIIGLLAGGIAVFAYTQLKPTPTSSMSPSPQPISSPTVSPSTNSNDLISIDKGQFSEYETQEPTVIVARNDNEWKELWSKHNINLKTIPRIDFSKKQVVGVFLGTSGGGDTIEITSILPNNTNIIVKAIHTSPKDGCLFPAVITHPYHFISVPIYSGELELDLKKQSDCN